VIVEERHSCVSVLSLAHAVRSWHGPAVPTVIFEPDPLDKSPSRQPLVVAVPEGGPLVDVCDARRAPIPFSCKSANCGTCRFEVLDGLGELLPAADDELDVLDVFSAPPHHRLACQAKMKPGTATLRIRAVDPDL
jgi:2Fe-2S ferredoxin